MKKILLSIIVFVTFAAFGVPMTFAAPFNANNNPNIVANYPTGDHTVIMPDGSIVYNQQGADIVMMNKNSGNAQQWYDNGDGGVHTNFKDVGQATTCSNGWTFVGQANPSWGGYFVVGDNYCAKSNSF